MKRLLLLSLLLLVAACSNATVPVEPIPAGETRPRIQLEFTPYENEAGFDLLYPSGWTYNIISPGLMVFAAPEDLTIDENSRAASLVVLRDAGDAGKTIEEQFDHYVSSGPLNTGYEIIRDAEQFEVSGYETWGTTVRNSAEKSLTSHIVFTETKLGFSYVFAATAPTEDWNEWWPSFQVMVDSIEINE